MSWWKNYKLKVGVSWAQVVDDMIPAIPTIDTGVQVYVAARKLNPLLSKNRLKQLLV